MLEVPFDELVKGQTYYIQSNSSNNPDVDRSYKKMGEFAYYYTTMYDDEDLTIAQFKNIRDIPNSSGRPHNYPSSSANGFIEETTRFFLPQKDKLMFKQVMSGFTKSDTIGKDLANSYFGGKKRKNNVSSKRRKNRNKTKTSKKRKTKRNKYL
jgi:hypothetical protein